MPLQKRRLGKARVHHRRSAWAASFKKPAATQCPRCSAPRLPHRLCMQCGYYGNRQVVESAEQRNTKDTPETSEA